MRLEKYSFGIGDRFGQQGFYQLKAVMKAKEMGIDIAPVWNKSNREHTIVHTEPGDVRLEADQAVKKQAGKGNIWWMLITSIWEMLKSISVHLISSPLM
jgi:hypothetical protein